MGDLKVAAAIGAAVEYEVGGWEAREPISLAFRRKRISKAVAEADAGHDARVAHRLESVAFERGNHAHLGVTVPMPVRGSGSVEPEADPACLEALDRLDAIYSQQLKRGMVKSGMKVSVAVVDAKLRTVASLDADGGDLLVEDILEAADAKEMVASVATASKPTGLGQLAQQMMLKYHPMPAWLAGRLTKASGT
jgi:hypothetical protein